MAETLNSLAFLLIFPWCGLSFVGGVFIHKLWVSMDKKENKDV